MIDAASEPGSYADALRFPPWLQWGHDGVTFSNISFLTPDVALQRAVDAAQGHRDGGPADVAFPFHAEPDATASKDNLHAR